MAFFSKTNVMLTFLQMQKQWFEQKTAIFSPNFSAKIFLK
jgi:hypothetical protein